MQYNTLFKDWLSKSGINEETQKFFNIHTGEHPSLGTCIVIPITDENGTHLFNKYRKNPFDDSTKPKYTYDKGGSIQLFGLSTALNYDQILITEGEKDSLVAWSHNIPAISSTGGAMSFQKEWVDVLKDKDITICFDNDDAGIDGMVKVLELLPHAKILLLPTIKGIKDISDYVAAGRDLHTLLKTARNYKNIVEVKQEMNERHAAYQDVRFHERYIKKNTRPKTVLKGKVKSTGDDITSVKQIPISDFMKFNYQNKVCCLWHNEKTPSLQYYPETNSMYCFGSCGKRYDVIDVYMQLNNCDLKTAINDLKKRII